MLALGEVTEWARVEVAQILDRSIDEIDPNQTFSKLGIDSGMATHLLIAIEEKLKVELDPEIVANLPTINTLCAYAVGLAHGGKSSL